MASGSRRIEYTESISKEISKALLSAVTEGLFVWSLEGGKGKDRRREDTGKLRTGRPLRYACGGGNGGDQRARSQRNGASYRGSVSSGPCEQRGCSGTLREHEA